MIRRWTQVNPCEKLAGVSTGGMNRHLTHYFTVNTPGMIADKLHEWLAMNQHLKLVSASHSVHESPGGDTIVSVLVVCIPWRQDEEDGLSGEDGLLGDGDG